MKEIIKEIIEFDLDEGRMDYLDDMIDVFSKDGCEMVDILFDRFLKKYYCDSVGRQPDCMGKVAYTVGAAGHYHLCQHQ